MAQVINELKQNSRLPTLIYQHRTNKEGKQIESRETKDYVLGVGKDKAIIKKIFKFNLEIAKSR